MLCDDINGLIFHIKEENTVFGHIGDELPSLQIDSQYIKQRNKIFLSNNFSFFKNIQNGESLISNPTQTQQDISQYIQEIASYQQEALDYQPLLFVQRHSQQQNQIRQNICEEIFNDTNCQNLFFANEDFCTLVANGLVNGTILNYGEKDIQINLFKQGIFLSKQQEILNIEEGKLANFLMNCIKSQKKDNFFLPQEIIDIDVTQQQEDKVSFKFQRINNQLIWEFYLKKYLNQSIKELIKQTENTTDETLRLQLPDNSEIQIDQQQFRDNIHNTYFKNSGLKTTEQLVSSLKRFNKESDQQIDMKILQIGEFANQKIFNQMLERNLREISFSNEESQIVQVDSLLDRRFSSFIGASLLGSLPSYQSQWVSKQEYQEQGLSIVKWKCLN